MQDKGYLNGQKGGGGPKYVFFGEKRVSFSFSGKSEPRIEKTFVLIPINFIISSEKNYK